MIPTGVLGVPSQVGDVEGDIISRDEPLELGGVEEAQPARGHDGVQPREQRLALRRDLLVEAIVSHQVDVLDAVVGRDGDRVATVSQVDGGARAKLFGVDGEGEAQVVLDVAVVALEKVERRGELGVERRQLVERRVLAEQLRCEEGREGELYHQALVDRLAEHAPDEVKQPQVVGVGGLRRRVGVQVALDRAAKVASLWVEGLRDDILHELLEHPGAVDASLRHAESIDELDAHRPLESLGVKLPQLHVTVFQKAFAPYLDALATEMLRQRLVWERRLLLGHEISK
mmetsp:Transcript_50598/g.131634  ORF Transcript_50598/g.131634 Transcript_50598/m.131634 type:complete len:287 (-) Transcript_50598:230-1090(-)